MGVSTRHVRRFAGTFGLAAGLVLTLALVGLLLGPAPAAAALVLVVCTYLALCRYLLEPLARARQAQESALRRSEERLQLALAGSNDALFDYDPLRERLYLSTTFRRWLGGHAPEATPGDRGAEVRSEEVLKWLHPDDAGRVWSAFRACAETGRSFDIEFQVVRSIGQPLWLQARGRGVFLEEGRYRVSGFAADVTARKEAETLLQDTVDRLEAVLDNIAEGIVTLNEAGEVCSVNSAAQQMFGSRREALVGRKLARLLELPGSPLDLAVLADRQPRSGVGIPDCAPAFPAEFTVSAMHMRSGSAAGHAGDERYIVVLRDITERKVSEHRLQRAIEEAQAATRAKDDFLATMSHEIRTPMNGVLGMVQLLLDTELTSDQQECAQLIRSSGEALLTILNDILDFSRAGSGQLKVDSIPFDLRDVVRDVAELLGRGHGSLDLFVDHPPDLPARLLGDPGRIRQVLMNLVGNALKFTERGHVAIVVGGRWNVSEEPVAHLEITVEDTGPGIPEEARARLFEPFTQADASTTRRFGGTGLGLAVSRRLVQLMGGEIDVQSVCGTGSRFRFRLALPIQTAAPPAATALALEGRRVLVVHQDSRGREIFAGGLSRSGAQVTTADSGSAAMTCLEQAEFDVVVVDEDLPGAEGFGLCECIRGDSRWPSLALVLLCGADERTAEEANPAADARLLRPVMPGALTQTLCSVLAPRRARRLQGVARGAGEPGLSSTPRGAESMPAERPRVLLAEDNAVNQKVALRMLEKAGCRIDVADNGLQALDLWRRRAYDVVFMDCQMPELDGLEAARQIRREEARQGSARTPIVAMTANAMRQDRSACLAAGMDDYLSKPVHQQELIEAVARWATVRAVRKAAG